MPQDEDSMRINQEIERVLEIVEDTAQK